MIFIIKKSENTHNESMSLETRKTHLFSDTELTKNIS